ncbi:hypothetical protein LL033_01185 [Clostridium estertheticum]|uniref:hypothetical protein n=1 Tax=Clostridium estertheticum TaxID=238834 RepID=UPI001C0D634B|nr:hypothetical protein [Clostridium estertheticum]MBU3218192.1 hypothetical protein [Clostridium estertheticum]WAG55881.1 hypothetical protein LL033_01185 [Clostridium estertheticum]
MDENKMFDLLEKIYVEVQETKKEVKSHTDKFNNVDNRLDGLENEIKKLGARIDGKLIPTSDALLDGYKVNSEHITIIDDKIDRLQIDVNSISMKVSNKFL